MILSTVPWQPEARVRPAGNRTDAAVSLALYGQFGWHELTGAVADAYLRLPPAEQQHTAIVTDDYWQASAVDRYGRPHGLPADYSPHRGFGYFGAPPESATTVLYVAENAKALQPYFTDIGAIGRVDSRLGIEG